MDTLFDAKNVLRDTEGIPILDSTDETIRGKDSLTKHEAIKEYFTPIVEEIAKDLLGFNFSPESEESISMITSYSDKVIRRYITGKVQKEYGLSIVIVKAYSNGNDDLNIDAMNFAQAFMDWLDEQNKSRIYPDFGEKCKIESIDNLQNMPNLAGVNYEEGLARYMIQIRILYTEES